ncbi:MAG: tRNA adenosine(34) deaminase TadA [Deltaproteobacteria bacterium]|nr:tRNA adenosine(34) deaminase TadA [Deltaproteobacteria bacterium]
MLKKDESPGYHENFMRKAIEAASQAQKAGEVPVGAVLVGEDDQILGVGYNQVIALSDPTAHAEILALRQAARTHVNYRLPGTLLYVTIEPCLMCAGAILQSRVKKLIFGAHDPKGGVFGSLYNLAQDHRLNHRIEVISGILASEAQAMLQAFFRHKRSEERYRSGRNGVDSKST